MADLTLYGRHIRLEPLGLGHIEALAATAAADPSLYEWSLVPQGVAETTRYVETAMSWRETGTAIPFAVVRLSDDAVIGSTRFWNLERWRWPVGHARFGNPNPDVCEIGYTWYGREGIRTAANTEAKLLMLTHAFGVWNTLCVCLHTDLRNLRSQAAMERIGCKRDGVLRAHRMAADFTPRDSVRYSIVAAEWPEVRQWIIGLLRS
jgi:RimJ/RimL family protein N-acetyltransferase